MMCITDFCSSKVFCSQYGIPIDREAISRMDEDFVYYVYSIALECDLAPDKWTGFVNYYPAVLVECDKFDNYNIFLQFKEEKEGKSYVFFEHLIPDEKIAERIDYNR